MSDDKKEKKGYDNQKILGFPQKMLHWFIYVLLGSVVLTAVSQLFGLPSAVANNKNRIDVLERVVQENKQISQDLLKAVNHQNVINNDMLKGVQSISKQTERTNKLLKDINETNIKIISKSVEQDVRMSNLERITYKD